MSCVNGTGGCGQVRTDPTSYREVFQGRIRHGVRIDPRTLQGEAGFYGGRDPNCCPSQRLLVQLKLRGDSLVLVGHTLVPEH